MNLSTRALKIISSPEHLHLRNRLALELGVSAYTIGRYINSNTWQLTTADALRIIREETGLSDSELLGNKNHSHANAKGN
ncbi:MAG: hypothetical protein DWQ44_00090 [Bacteroidetes bacterium]|nr:MAG: hypothetical protein DWQ33_05040 [Bacteroidota bacterium]REK06029.1 MAG: hypothetical protein DWQ39_04180 [Bacteroidota bacterium]REK37087.1 MAG: hypothetical protein DWQ44_00090 [Bacteroidota bacterium]REK47520.1 MAG: hypothetical protein DWQ48_12355 [Bacteroidota bacterium]